MFNDSELHLLELSRKKEFERQYNLILAFKKFLNNIHSVVKQENINFYHRDQSPKNIEDRGNDNINLDHKNTQKKKKKGKAQCQKEENSHINTQDFKMTKSKSLDCKKKNFDEFFLKSKKKCRERMAVRISDLPN
jgi:hypothetical protein